MMRIQPGEELGEKEHRVPGRGNRSGESLAHSRRLWKTRWQEFGWRARWWTISWKRWTGEQLHEALYTAARGSNSTLNVFGVCSEVCGQMPFHMCLK